MPHKRRTIIQSEQFLASAAKLVGGIQRLDEALVAADWAVCANPLWGREVPGTPWRAFPVVMPEGEVLIFYSTESDQIILQDLFLSSHES